METKEITLQIDRHSITVPAGTTILEAATEIGINIPTLCHIDLKGTCIKNNPASCRICVVEVEGRRNLAPACATKCTEGMVVRTSTLRVMNARKVVAELILSDHPNDCLTCPKSGNCELQNLALRFNVREMPFNGGELSLRKREVTSSIVRNMDKCIFCRRCESVCNDVQTVGALGAVRRGFNTTIAPAFDKKMSESECTYCGQCVAVCPVGALTERDHTNRLLEDQLACTVVEQVKSLCDQHGNDPGELINILHEAQHLHGYLPEEMQRIIAHKLNIPVSKVYGVVTFYTFFTMTPKGKHPISVCMGTACYVRGSISANCTSL